MKLLKAERKIVRNQQDEGEEFKVVRGFYK